MVNFIKHLIFVRVYGAPEVNYYSKPVSTIHLWGVLSRFVKGKVSA
jgi:hypothetical protein